MGNNKIFDDIKLPVLPLRDIIVFPHMVIPLFVGREKSILALEKAEKLGNKIFLITQKDPDVLDPELEDLNHTGTVVNIIQMLRLPDNTIKVLIEGLQRATISEFFNSAQGHEAVVVKCEEISDDEVKLEALIRSVKSTFEQYVKLNKKIPPELLMSISSISDPSRLADLIVTHLSIKVESKQQILDSLCLEQRLSILLEKMQGEIEIINVERKIKSRVKTQMERSQKEYYLNEQMSAIQRELGSKDDKNEIEDLAKQLRSKSMPVEAFKKTEKEIQKLKTMSPMSAEAAVVRGYVDWMLSLPWNEISKDDHDIKNAADILNREHFGLEDVKDRILEYLAVRTLVQDGEARGTLLCMSGPPGVGKTSIAKSLANSMNRKFVRISLGGVRDEAEIRGHRRTYVGAMPGKIIQALKRAGTSNPVILLDEIDKLTSDMRGDPASALLEVLDPEQNKTFVDHYVEVDYDLSNVMFIMTANNIANIPGPLRDRMEIVDIAGYTPQEKKQIAKSYLFPKVVKRTGLREDQIKMTDKIFHNVIEGYTREAGVRGLERLISTICRKVAKDIVMGKADSNKEIKITEKLVEKFLGPKMFDRTDRAINPEIGLCNGLAYTSVGGELLHIEVVATPGDGKIRLTGKLGDVMQESAQTALSFVRSIAPRIDVEANWFKTHDLHIHVPSGAVPKDGPSAGITLATTITSAITQIPIKQDVAMTGEISLRGKVLPIGGVKEKLLAAKLAGVTDIILPEKNMKDLVKVPDDIKSGLSITGVSEAEEVIRLALDLTDKENFLTPFSPLKVVKENGKEGLKVAN